MSQNCPSCGLENSDEAKFCASCGTTLDHSKNESTAEPEEKLRKELAKATPAKKPRSCRPYFIGCLVLLLIALIVLPILHFTLLRPYVQNKIFKWLEDEVQNFVLPEYQEDFLGIEVHDEEEINDSLEEIWDEIPIVHSGHIGFQQDEISLSLSAFKFEYQVAVDIRVDDRGDILIKSLKMDWPFYLFVTSKGLKGGIEEIINTNFVQPRNLAFQAIQVTNNKIFLAYEARSD